MKLIKSLIDVVPGAETNFKKYILSGMLHLTMKDKLNNDVYMNPVFVNYYGYTEEEDDFDLVYIDDQELVKAYLDAFFKKIDWKTQYNYDLVRAIFEINEALLNKPLVLDSIGTNIAIKVDPETINDYFKSININVDEIVSKFEDFNKTYVDFMKSLLIKTDEAK